MGRFDDIDIAEEEFTGDIEKQNKNEERMVAFYSENVKCLAYCTGIGLVALILGLALGLGLEGGSGSGTSYGDKSVQEQTLNYVTDLAKTISPDAQLNVNFKIPQTKALQWMSSDPYTVEQVKRAKPRDDILLDRYAAVTFYYATNGESWKHQINFLSPDHICKWKDNKSTKETDYMESSSRGILCNEEFAVKALVFNNNDLEGKIPDELYHLSLLQKIDFASNQLDGTISSKLSSLKYLNILKMDRNKLEGELNQTIGSLSELTYFNVNNNYLEGNVETSFQNLTGLAMLDIGDNFFVGNFPDISASTRLRRIILERNGHVFNHTGFTGKIPTFIGNFESLEILSLSANSFSGEIPPELGQLQGLTVLDIHTNYFSGNIPNGLLNSKKLDKLFLNGNNFQGNFGNVCTALDDIKMTADCLLQDNTNLKVECDCCYYCCNDDFCCPRGESVGSSKCKSLDFISAPEW